MTTEVTGNRAYEPPPHFPVLVMAVLSTAVLASAISISNLFPYVGFMVIDMGLAKDANSAGNYAGFIASAMMCGRFISSYYWGQTADRVGRKPVLMIGTQ
jgi:MFS family permease